MRTKKKAVGRGERLQIMLTPEELLVVDNFRFEHRMPSRASAVRELFRLGLANAKSVVNVDGKKSSDFSVLPDAGGKGKSAAAG